MIAYLDMPAGISGDIFLGCLVGAGWPIAQLQACIANLQLSDECTVAQRQVHKGALAATQVVVNAQEGHVQRHLGDVRAIIEKAKLPGVIKQQATAVFTRLAAAEAHVHGTTPEKIHFHEVGAVDAIVDIVGVVTGLHELGITKLFASPVATGSGWVNSAHGQIPVPAPATLELLAAAGAPTRLGPGAGELTTPTGAALVVQLATFGQPPMSLSKIGTGAGQRECAWPNVARLWVGDLNEPAAGAMVQLDTNIDDMNPQLYGAVSDKLFSAGARDVWFTPIQMKKNRPGILLSTLGPSALEGTLTQILLRETTTLGVRAINLDHRHEARREIHDTQTPFGNARIKVKWIGAEAVGALPEYDDVKALAEVAGKPVRDVYDTVMVCAQQLLASLNKRG